MLAIFSAHICAVFKAAPLEEGAKLDDPEIDKELVHLVMDKVDQVPILPKVTNI
jgi:hypothetical protein